MSIQTPKIEKITLSQIQKKKNQEKITMITAYDALFAKIFDGEVDMILVGDSLEMSFFGAKDTLGATLEQMIYHTQAVCNGAKKSLIVCDIPFGSNLDSQTMLQNATRIYKETEAQAIKIEGGREIAPTINLLNQKGIATLAHIGLKPQFARMEGGYKIQGKEEKQAQSLLQDALELQDAGAFCLLLEGIKAEVAETITQKVKIPTIGIGSGVGVDGQVLVWSDAFGFFEDFKPKFVRHYLKGANLIRDALKNYVQDVKTSKFPSLDESY
ncbi:MAG: 3-methyl-2-oxobutanoate hydroxymethyltransferase [Helicobacter sp.]|nr:3-methyl-2-oxobutanoate hydroxymethyltransferase [Helicobacter sp.]